jgi:hypothetical protein
MTNKEEKEGQQQQQQQKNDNKIPKNDYSYLHKKAGFLPPQALPTPPPPPPIPNEDTSSLTSPWWSEETSDTSKEEIQEQEGMSETIATTTTATTTSTSATTTTSTTNGENTTITLLGFGRSSKSKGEWNEKCYMLATTQGGGKKDENFDKEFKRLTEQSKDCSMVCFLKESKQLTQQRRQQVSMWDDYNPFFGTWITVTRSPTKCRQHLETEYIQKKNQSDYYTMELGDGLYHSGEYGKLK